MTRIFHPVGIYSLTLPRRLRVIQVCRFVVYFRTILVLPVVPLLALRRHEAILEDKSFHPKNVMHTHALLDDSFWKTWIHEKKGKPFPRSTTESQPTTRTRTGSWRITGPQNYSTTLDTGPRITATARSRLWNVWDNFSHPYFPRTMMMTTTTTCSRSHKDQWKCGGEWKSSEKKWEKLLTTTIPRTGTPLLVLTDATTEWENKYVRNGVFTSTEVSLLRTRNQNKRSTFWQFSFERKLGPQSIENVCGKVRPAGMQFQSSIERRNTSQLPT